MAHCSTCWSIHPQGSPDLLRRPSQPDSPLLGHLVQPRTHPSSQPKDSHLPSHPGNLSPGHCSAIVPASLTTHCPTCRSTPLPCPDRALSRKAVLEQRHHVSHSIHPAVFVPFSSAIISNLCRPAVPPSYLPHPVVYHPSNSVTISPIQPSIVQQRLVQQ